MDEAYRWLGYKQKGKAVELIGKIGLLETIDFNISRSGNNSQSSKRGPKTIQYHLKPSSFKKLLLAAQTQAAKKAADYFIKVEEAIPEFYRQGGTTFSQPPRDPKWKSLALEHYTEPLKSPPIITSAGYDEDLSDPQLYLGIPKNVTFPPGVVPDGAAVVEFGWTSSSGKRFEAHRKSHGEFHALDHFPSLDSPALESETKRLLEIKGRRIYGKRQDGSKNTELFYVFHQEDYASFAARIYEAQQKLMSSLCCVQAEREKRLTAEADLAREKERTIQELEKTRQLKEQVQISANEALKAQAQAQAQAQISANELELKRLELQLRLQV